jgi:beta-lactamase class A
MDSSADLDSLLTSRVQAIAGRLTDGAVAVSAYDYLSGRYWSVNGNDWFHAASLVKLAVLVGLFDAADRGHFTLDCRLHVRNRFLSVVDRVPFRVDPGRDADADVHAAIGRTMRLHELARHMIITSSNLATNLLLDLVGVEPVRATLLRLGIEGVDLQRGVEDDRAFEAGISNRITANGACALLRAIVDAKARAPRPSSEMLDILHDQRFQGVIAAGLPESIRPAARVAHKTGEISSVTHDAGIVFVPSRPPFAVAILVASSGGARERVDAGEAAAAAVYECVAVAGEGVSR